jgi:hypothetical protein
MTSGTEALFGLSIDLPDDYFYFNFKMKNKAKVNTDVSARVNKRQQQYLVDRSAKTGESVSAIVRALIDKDMRRNFGLGDDDELESE